MSESFDPDYQMVCDECDHIGDKESDTWFMMDDGKVICLSCQNQMEVLDQ
jgi:uncharacterized membrane protein